MKDFEKASIEEPKEIQIKTTVEQLHNDFYKKAPRYEKAAWNPVESIKKGSGSCMAELLYVAGGLIGGGLVNEQDIFVGFSKTHGEEQPIGFVGKKGKKYAHTFMLITVKDGLTLEMDFRSNRADETPRIQRLAQDELDMDCVGVHSLGDSINEYARIEGGTDLTISDLINLHKEYNQTSSEENEMRFDLDF